ncbi:MAG TPA: sulfatase [Terriglobales bacterium]|nr:sulfatase [Terriglobales bacterium]
MTPNAAQPVSPSQIQKPSAKGVPAAILLLVGAWFGIVTGLVEGLGLLLFQRINWRQWGRMMHVSKEILWVSPLVDLILFLLVALAVWLVSRIFKRMPAIPVLLFILSFMAAYDWLTLTGRLYPRACWLLALGLAAVFVRWMAAREPAALRFWRKSWGYAIAVLLLLFFAIQGGKRLRERIAESSLPEAAPGSPNVLVVVVDTLRADHLSTYGYKRPTSPVMDRVARQGVLFENAFAPCSWSLPSHASLVTGRYPLEHGLVNVQPMPWMGWGATALNGYPTLGEALQRRGYRTGAFSANRVYFSRDVGLGRGFIHFEDYFSSAGDALTRTLYGRKIARFYFYRSNKSKVTRALRHLGLGSWLDQDSEGSGEYGGAFGVRKRASDVNQEVLRWVAGDRKRPFFAFLNYLDVHYKYGGPWDYPKPAWDKGKAIDEYDAGIAYVDDYIGRLLERMQQLGMAQNTIVVITSDHGESLGDHGLTYHGAALYRELIRVPLIISDLGSHPGPGHIPNGLRIAAPVSNAAIAATVLDLLGPNPVDGHDRKIFPGPPLSEMWRSTGTDMHWPDPLSQLPQTNIVVREDRAVEARVPIATTGSMESLITPRWQLIVHQKFGAQLYDWVADPGELHDLAETPEGRAVIPGLLSEIEARKKGASQ